MDTIEFVKCLVLVFVMAVFCYSAFLVLKADKSQKNLNENKNQNLTLNFKNQNQIQIGQGFECPQLHRVFRHKSGRVLKRKNSGRVFAFKLIKTK